MDERSIFSRRRFLRVILGAGAGSAALVGGAAALFSLRGRAPAVAGLRCLSDHEYRTMRQLALALFPGEGGFPVGAEGMDLARSFDAFLADEPEWNRDDLKKGLFLLEYGPVIFERRLVTFSHLPAAERLAHFERWSEGGLVRRQLALALRRFLSLVFYDRPEVWPHLGYDGPLVR